MTTPRLRHPLASTALLVAAAALATPALADVVHDESVDGDLASMPDAPTPVAFAPGTNTIVGSVQSSADRRDFLTFTIPEGQVLSGIFLVEFVDGDTGGIADRGFVHLDDGPTTVVPSLVTAPDLLGGTHLDRTLFPTAGDNVLAALGAAADAGSGFDLPLGPGVYSMNIQQTGPELNAYRIDFVLEPAAPPCEGDLDGSGEVGFGDLLQLLSDFGPCAGCAADFDGSGAVDFSDLLVLLSAWGPCP